MARHNTTGKWGEDKACEYLTGNGYAIIARNVRFGHNELDIVAIKGNRISFVEVKTRTVNSDEILDALDDKKKHRLCNAAEAYMRMTRLPHEPQMDVIIVIGEPERDYTIEHYPDAFRPPLKCR